MDRAIEQKLISAIHKGVVDAAQWQNFVDGLRDALGVIHANLTFRRTDAPRSELTSYASGGPMEHMSEFYLGSYYRNDPLPYYRLFPGTLYTLQDLFDPADHSVWLQLRQLLAPFEGTDMLIMRISEPDGANAWLTVIGAEGPFECQDRELLQTLGVHLQIALTAYAKLAEAEARLAAYSNAMDRLNVGIVTLAADGRIINADPLVNRLLQDGQIISRDPQGRLVIANGNAARSLTLALRDFAQEPRGRPRAVRLSEAQQADMMLVPVADRPVTGRFTPVLRAYVHTDHLPAADSIDGLMEMFRLTRSEAKLALALSDGLTLAEAAERLGVTLQTVRTYSKRVFQKTGTRRQAELVRALLTSTLSLA
ncbi:helix-turn-helix transcriptional regulator [Novosphingobium cyanobacteriorum]|uniref:LuxR C-terminal-related transcriptional regulator n=1 Tax=Novosphingobium cyanobacteriorum TaxID=3024215 RepID=A0ABT6CM76_9SPHN|nr:LuxR C-terminal-related transcriptional regulator [Novosphingobium cyanobacteriorum]MDF8334673.1 LuxR C-terminal-related transcriptional regulator [Novosphingobium cyanobacteriorum]